MISNRHIEMITPLGDEVDQAAALIVHAFQDEALTNVWLDLSNERIKRAYEALVNEKLRTVIQAGQPVIAALSEGKVLGVAVMKSPGMKVGGMDGTSGVCPLHAAAVHPGAFGHPGRANGLLSAEAAVFIAKEPLRPRGDRRSPGSSGRRNRQPPARRGASALSPG